MKDQMVAFMKGRSTITSWNEDPKSLEFPTLTFCLDPATKLSVSQKFGFQSINDKFYNDVNDSTLENVFDSLTYQMGKDFQIISTFRKQVTLKEGLNTIKSQSGQDLIIDVLKAL